MPTDITLPCADGLVNLSVGAIILKDGRFLMAGNEREPYLYSVGGRIQFGETAEEAVLREVEEETGRRLEVDRLGFVHENFFTSDPRLHAGREVYEISLFFYMKTPQDFEPVSRSFTEDGAREFLAWIDFDDPRTIYPEFFRTELRKPEMGVKHFVTDGRDGWRGGQLDL